MAEIPTYARSWGINPLKERDEIIAVLDAWRDTQPRRRTRPQSNRGRWAAGAIALSLSAVFASVAFPEAVQLLIAL